MIRYFDMFAGIGGFRAGLSLIDGFECVGHCEIDQNADASYRAIHKIKEGEWFCNDAKKIDAGEMPDFDLLCGGFPCQSFSNAGKRLGFEDARGTLFFEIARVARQKRPKYILLENVPGLLSHDKGRTFATILSTLNDMGYSVEWQVLNSADFGVPQSRKRVYIVGYSNERCTGKVLPILGTNPKAIIQVISGPQGSRVYDPQGLSCTLTSEGGGFGGRTGLYAVGFNRKDGITGLIDQAKTLNASDYRGINRNQTQNAVFEIATNPTPMLQKEKGLYFIDLTKGNPRITPIARCLTATYSKGMSNHNGERSGVLKTEEVCAVLTPKRSKVRQNGRRIKSPGEPMFTLTAQDQHGVLLIQEATKRGFKEAYAGDSVDIGYAGINSRRGRVGKEIAHTIVTGGCQGTVTVEGRIRRLTPKECLRLQGFRDDQIDQMQAVNSDAQIYKQAGNSVTVNVIYALGLRIIEVDQKTNNDRGGLYS